MTATEKIKKEYLAHMRRLLCDYPEELRTFEQLWKAGQLREAYLSVDETVRKLKIVLSPEQQKADESFYWDIVN